MAKGFLIAGLVLVMAGAARSQDRDKTGTPASEIGPTGKNQRKSQSENWPGKRATQNATLCVHGSGNLSHFSTGKETPSPP